MTKEFVTTFFVVAMVFIVAMVAVDTFKIGNKNQPIPPQLLQLQMEYHRIVSKAEQTQRRQDAILDLLAFCESSNNPTAVNPKDTDGKPKYGLFQYGTDTLKEKWYQYTGEKVNNEEAIAIAFNPLLARELTHYVIFVRHEWNRWGCWSLINK